MNAEMRKALEELRKLKEKRSAMQPLAQNADEQQIEQRAQEIAEIEEKEAELSRTVARIAEEERQAALVSHGAGREVSTPSQRRSGPVTRDSEEYRDAFLADLLGEATKEQRDALITTENGIVLPTTIETKIWDLIHSAHPILNDITLFSTGTILTINQHKAITAGKAKKVAEGTANADEENTFTKIVLTGKDYSKNVELSYAEAKMTKGAMEQYLVKEISADLGEEMAKDVFARIKSDLGSAAVTVKKDAKATYENLATAAGTASEASTLTVYCSNKRKWELLGMVDTNGQPIFRDGVSGFSITVDSAAGDDIFLLDPQNFEANMIQPIMIESDRDIKAHKIVYSGYARMEGAMRDTRTGAYITWALA